MKKKPKSRGLPAKKSVVAKKTFVSPKGKRYTIIETDEVDEYEEIPRQARDDTEK